MPAVYLVGEVYEITDAETFGKYLPLSAAVLAKYGGEYLIRGGKIETIEGEPANRLVLVKFESEEAARRWYASPEYQEVKALRDRSSRMRMHMVEGV